MFLCYNIIVLASCNTGANVEQYHQTFSQIDNQRTSTLGEHSAPTFYPNQFDESTIINTRHYMLPHASGGLPPSTSSSQWIPPSSPQQHTLQGPSRDNVHPQLG